LKFDNNEATLIELFKKPIVEPIVNPEKIKTWALNRIKYIEIS